jgi:glycine/D-amino acid oxidase-like deaminating enzyme
MLDRAQLREVEPYLAHDVAGGAYFCDDAQVQPMQACSVLLAAAQSFGATVFTPSDVLDIQRDRHGAICGVRTTEGQYATPRVVLAAGPWTASLAAMVGAHIPVQPRKGHIVVTEALPALVHHKVYDAAYEGTVNSNASSLHIASVVEATKSGTMLLGSSRQLKGFDPAVEVPVVRALVRRAVRFFPVLAQVQAIRAYVGFRPFMPDHLPVIGEVPGVPGLFVNTGHEGAGIGLGPISAKLLARTMVGQRPELDLAPFSPARFTSTPVLSG